MTAGSSVPHAGLWGAATACHRLDGSLHLIPLLLERLDLTGALVTIDAMGTQTAIGETIVRRGGDYLLALKANRPTTYDDVGRFFDDPPPAMIETVSKRTNTASKPDASLPTSIQTTSPNPPRRVAVNPKRFPWAFWIRPDSATHPHQGA